MTSTTWYSDDDEAALKEHAWFRANAGGKSHPVRQKTPDAWGLYDMHGNAWEWCQDRFADRYYATPPMDDPTGPSEGPERVRRGGSWYVDEFLGRASFRSRNDPGPRGEGRGYRVARTVTSPSPSR